MKRFITIIMAIALLLSGCSKKELLWSETKSLYENAMNEAIDEANKAETFLEEDYKYAINMIEAHYEEIKKGISDKNSASAAAMYRSAALIKTVALGFDSDAAISLADFAQSAIFVIEAAHDDVNGDFEIAKSQFEERLEAIKNMTDVEYDAALRKAKLKWQDVESEFEAIANEALETQTRYAEVTSFELEELKHDIIDSYELIKDGVTEDTNDIAMSVYRAAVKLKDYTEGLYADEATTVYEFADKTISFVKSCYVGGGDVMNEYGDDIARAKKWTQSTWNIITMYLGM